MMSRGALKLLLVLSLALNAGVIAAFGVHVWRDGEWPSVQVIPERFSGLPAYLEMSDEQTKRWHALESEFIPSLHAGSARIQAHRERMLQAIFAEPPDLAAIETERAAIAAGQEQQQKLVIAQLLKEQALLDARQRALLADLLRQKATPAGDTIELLHRK